jgi:hypothetical protein
MDLGRCEMRHIDIDEIVIFDRLTVISFSYYARTSSIQNGNHVPDPSSYSSTPFVC